MRRTLSDSLNAAYRKMMIKESEVHEHSVQKALRLFGYPNAQNQRYVCCASESPRIDIHTYSIAGRNFVMCLITDESRNVKDSALWDIPTSLQVQKSNFDGIHSIEDVDKVLDDITNHKYQLVMRY